MSTASPTTRVRTALVMPAHPDDVDFGAAPWTVRELWLVDGPAAPRDHAVDITDTFGKRMAALRAHVSQVGENQNLEERMRPYFAAVACKYGLPDGHLAEEFQVVDTS